MSPAAAPVKVFSIAALAMVVAIALGLAASTGQLLPIAAVTLPLGALVALMLRPEWTIRLLFVLAWVVSGSVEYFARVGQAQWLPVGMGLALYAVLLFRLVGGGLPQRRTAQPLVYVAGLFVLMALASTAWSGQGIVPWVYSARFYLGIGSLMLALAYLPLPQALLERLWQSLMVVTVIQLPVVLYQFLFVSRRRAESAFGGLSFDSIVGTMGGNQEAGGQSAALGFFVLSALVLALALWKRGLLGAWRVAALAVVVVVVIFLAEVKFYGLLLPVALLLLFRGQFLLRPSNLFAGLALAGVVALGMPVVYSVLHYAQSSWADHPTSVFEFYQWMFSRTDPRLVNQTSGEMGRVTQLVFWYEQNHLLSRPMEFLLGHGMGSTSVSQLGLGDVTRRYFPIQVGTSTAAVMLWEVGLVGLITAIVGLLASAAASLRLSRHAAIPAFHRAALEAGFVISLVAVPALFYKFFALQSPAIQSLMFLVVGQACFWRARLAMTTAR